MHTNGKLVLIISLMLFALPAHAEEPPKATTSSDTSTTKILGGTQANPDAWPWVAALIYSNQTDMWKGQFCGGSLIDDTWILTAAHCVTGKLASQIDVAVGVFDLKNFSGSRIKVKNIYKHPYYNTTNSQNDIALLELSQPSTQPTILLFSGKSREAAPPSMVGRTVTAVGWGMADYYSSWYYPEKLRQVNLPVVADSKCNTIYPAPSLISSQLCAGKERHEGKDVCNGDSGGALVSQIDDAWVHIGLVSFGTPCKDYEGWYGVYTRTSGFKSFIKQHAPDAKFTSSTIPPPTLTWMQLLLKQQ